MNLTAGTTLPSTWKRIKIEYVAAIAGLALAVSAVAVVALPDGGSSARTAPFAAPAIAAPASVSPGAQPATTIYVVSSQAEADVIAAGATEGLTNVQVIVADPSDTQAESALATTYAEALLVGENGLLQSAQIIDLRAR